MDEDVPSQKTELCSQRAEIFRSKLISDFHLLDIITEQGSQVEAPKFYTHDLLIKSKLRRIMRTKPQGLVRFQVYHNKEKRQLIHSAITDRRINRVRARNAKYPPLDLWAHWILERPSFQNFILGLILINSVVLGIEAEISEIKSEAAQTARLVLKIFDYCTLFVFVIEIVLKWLDQFWAFWKNRWNCFDFVVTFLSFVPEIIDVFAKGKGGSTTSQLSSVANNMRTFRVLRSLKMVSRFQKVRLIVLAVTKAFQAMVFITVLLFIFAYIFAIMGVIFFDGYSETNEDLYYKDSFSNIIKALITLFQLFTLDHWREVYDDVCKVANPQFSFFYIFLWIILGSFIFRNIFVGIMVNNFQSIRNDLFEEVEEIQERERRDLQMVEFAEELDKQYQRPVGSSVAALATEVEECQSGEGHLPQAGSKWKIESLAELRAALSRHVVQTEYESTDWMEIVERNMETLAQEDSSYCWPRDTLFHYFLLMETLQENLGERKELLNLACEALLQIHDT